MGTEAHVRLSNKWIRLKLKEIPTRAAMLVYLVLRSYRHKDTCEAQPSQAQICKLTKLRPRTIQKAIADLRALELISVREERFITSKRWANNVYLVYDERVRTDFEPSSRAKKPHAE